MKIKLNKNFDITSLVSAILFLIIGAVMYTKPDFIVIFLSYVLGGILIILGVFKCFKNYLDVKKDTTTPATPMIFGIVLIAVGLVFIFLANVIEAVVRLFIGGWILFSGINRLINALYLDKKNNNFWVLLLLSLLLIGSGIYTILKANLAFQTIGIVIMIYSILEIFAYIFNKQNKENPKINKVIDAKLIETKENDN